jgi:ribonuclease-3
LALKDTDSRQQAVEEALDYRFRDRTLLRQALVHRSWAHEHGEERNNEPLEFLGDAVLGFLVAERIVRRRPDLDEGGMTRLRARLVNTRHLALEAEALGLGDALLLGRGEELSGGRTKHSLLADSFEAVLGAVFLDGGVRAARRLVWRLFGAFIDEVAGTSGRRGLDPKTELQELLQARGTSLPVYRVLEASGPDHARHFRVAVLVGDEICAEGKGSAKKRAEQAAAAAALAVLRTRR